MNSRHRTNDAGWKKPSSVADGSSRVATTIGRVTPQVQVSDVEHVLLVPRMVAIAVADLRDLRGQLGAHRDAIVAALDYLFLGV